jgi:hypothetical protein
MNTPTDTTQSTEGKRRLARAHAQQLRTLATLVEDSGEPLPNYLPETTIGAITRSQLTGAIHQRLYELELEAK